MPQPDVITTAQQELTEARALLESLTERVREGDQDVTPEQLAAQRELISFAELRVEAARRKRAAEVAAARDARGKAAGAAGRKLLSEDDARPVVDAVKAAVDALCHLTQVADDRYVRIRRTADEIVAVNEELKAQDNPGQRPFPTDRFGVRASTYPASVTVLREGCAVAVDVGTMVSVALQLALAGDRGAQDRVRSVLSSAGPNMIVQKACEDVPRLADALRLTPEEWEALDQPSRQDAYAQGRKPLPESAEG